MALVHLKLHPRYGQARPTLLVDRCGVGADLAQPMRTQKSNNQQPNRGREDDGKRSRMQYVLSPGLILRKVRTLFQVGVDQHQWRSAQSSLDGGLCNMQLITKSQE